MSSRKTTPAAVLADASFAAMRRVAALLIIHATKALEEGKICFNGCSGHGACDNFVCSCEPGWTGDDCSHSLVGGNGTVQMLTAGHFNVTAKNWTKLLKKKDVVFIAFGSRSCLRCVGAETAYADAAPLLKKWACRWLEPTRTSPSSGSCSRTCS